MKKTPAQHAAEVLRETGNPSVCFGDDGLIHAIGERCGFKPSAWKSRKTVCDAIDRSNSGELVKSFTLGHRWMRCYTLPEVAALRTAKKGKVKK